MLYDDEYTDNEYEEEELTPITGDSDDMVSIGPDDDSMDDSSVDNDSLDDEDSDSPSVKVHHRDPVDASAVSTVSSNRSANTSSDDDKVNEMASLLETTPSSQVSSEHQDDNKVSVFDENKSEYKPVSKGSSSLAPVDSGLGTYIPYAMMVSSLANSSTDKAGTPMTTNNTVVFKDSNEQSRKKSQKVIDLENQMSSIDKQIAEHSVKVADFAEKYQKALSTDVVLAGDYKQSKMKEESIISSLQAQKKSVQEQISLAIEQDDITFFCSNAERLYSVVSSISSTSVNVDFAHLSTEIDNTSTHLSDLLSSVSKKVDLYSSLLKSATDDIAKNRFHTLYNFYYTTTDSLVNSCSRIAEVHKLFSAKYKQHNHEIEQSKQLAMLISEMQPNNLLYSLFCNLGNQVFVLQKHIDSLETKLDAYKKSNADLCDTVKVLSGKVDSFSNDLQQNVEVILDDENSKKLSKTLGDSLSVSLENVIEQRTQNLSTTISDKVVSDFSPVIEQLKDSSQKFSDAAACTDVIRDTSNLLTQIKNDKDELSKQILDKFSSVPSSITKNLNTDLNRVLNDNLGALRKSLFVTGRTVFEGFARSYGILGQNRSVLYYLSSPMCVLILINLFLTLYILFTLHFGD